MFKLPLIQGSLMLLPISVSIKESTICAFALVGILSIHRNKGVYSLPLMLPPTSVGTQS